MNYVTYLRVSSKHQVQGDGFDRQRETIQKRMEATYPDAVHMAEFTEDGVSGTTDLINRPALTRLCQYAMERGGITMIVVEKSDRLARDLVVSELLLRQFSEMGITVIEAEGGTNLTAGNGDNPTAKLIRQILAAVSEFEKSSIVLKLRSARNRTRARTGRCEGRKPYGAIKGEEETVERIRQYRSSGMTTREIAAALNADSVRTRSGGEWRHSVVASVLNRQSDSV
jgi:DNA invertase Pin-like site-specific DNA recombinase